MVVCCLAARDGCHAGHNGATMQMRSRAALAVFVAICLSLALAIPSRAQTQPSVPNATQKGAPMPSHATGTFDVKLTPQGDGDTAEGSTLGRMSIEKQIHGDLEATSKGEMLTAGTHVKNSAGYVAFERITGTLHGLSGSFVLQHSGTLTRGAPQQSITVVPDSATGQLAGLTGKMTITIAEGKHSYDFEYTLPEATK
jgi:Protein of unknown function (DUF3224)